MRYKRMFPFAVHAQQKCANLPIESSPGQGDFWIGDWQYYQDNEKRLKIEANGKVSGGNFPNSQCEKIIIYKEATSTSAFYWGNMIVRSPTRLVI